MVKLTSGSGSQKNGDFWGREVAVAAEGVKSFVGSENEPGNGLGAVTLASVATND